jgi:hypothetical protein
MSNIKNEQSENLKHLLMKQRGQKTSHSNKKLSMLELCID